MAAILNPAGAESGVTATTKSATMPKKYRVKPAHAAKWPEMTSLVPKNLSEKVGGNVEVVSVALCGKDITVKKPGTATTLPYEVTVKAATQDQLKYLFNEGNPHVEEVDE